MIFGLYLYFTYFFDELIREDLIRVKPKNPFIGTTLFRELYLMTNGFPAIKNKPGSVSSRNFFCPVYAAGIYNHNFVGDLSSFFQSQGESFFFI